MTIAHNVYHIIFIAGQFVQTVYKHNRAAGALTQSFTPLATDANRWKIYAEWRRYWDVSKAVLLEKSPIHMYMTNVLQYWFSPERTSFIVVLRHPFSNWNYQRSANQSSHRAGYGVSLCGEKIVQRWLDHHEALFTDLKSIQNYAVVHFERFLLGDTNGLL